eukprot:g1972.t1
MLWFATPSDSGDFVVCDADPNEPRVTWEPSEHHPPVREGCLVTKLGYQFRWTQHHKTGAQLEPLRQIGDPLADAALEAMDTRLRPATDPLQLLRRLAAEEDAAAGASTGGGACAALLAQAREVPAWVDWDAVQRGQDVFHRYGPGAGIALLYLSLVGGFSAPKINKVLTSTGYLSGAGKGGREATWRRLWETTQMILDCMEPGALREGGVGWCSVLRVRFLHAK